MYFQDEELRKKQISFLFFFLIKQIYQEKANLLLQCYINLNRNYVVFFNLAFFVVFFFSFKNLNNLDERIRESIFKATLSFAGK